MSEYQQDNYPGEDDQEEGRIMERCYWSSPTPVDPKNLVGAGLVELIGDQIGDQLEAMERLRRHESEKSKKDTHFE